MSSFETSQWIDSETSYLIERIKIYGEVLDRDSLLKSLEAIQAAIGEITEGDSHDTCVDSSDHYKLEEERDELQEQIEKLETKLEKRLDQSKLRKRIQELEDELSDVRADLNVYRDRIEKGATHAKLADMFIFTPEDARAHFRCVTGGVS